ncbi:MAG TPA: protoporphyrinogen oxidase [Candidatus Hydrogenedentes bacterium]|nr:protoporphyrinogen oxidase [Candidatus Hydrogenedentota bacterium]
MAISIGIIGAGISGLTIAYRLKRLLKGAGIEYDLDIYERTKRLGGSIGSERISGFLVEWGPNGFLNNEPATFDLIHQLGLRDRLVASSDAARKRYLNINRKLHQIPLSPSEFLKTPIVPFQSKIRFALEPLMPRRTDGRDESVAEFVARRFGKKAVERMFDPLISGVYAGNVNTLSINSTLKVFAELEREYGSVVKGMIARVKQRKAEERSGEAREKVDELLTTSKNPMSGKLLSFQNGMDELVEELGVHLEDHLQMGVHLEAIRRTKDGYELTGQNSEGPMCRRHDVLVLASPPQSAAALVNSLDSDLAKILREIMSSTIAVLALGFQESGIAHPLDGFGYLIPRNQNVRSLGVLWSSSIFPNRAPGGHKLLQIMIGGAHDPGAVDEDDQKLVETAIKDADPVLGFKANPIMTRVIRHRCGIPQYTLGHQARLEAITQCLEKLPGFYLAGNGYHGISSNDCIRCTGDLAHKIVNVHAGMR